MSNTASFTCRAAVLLAGLAVAALALAQATSQSWEYRSFRKNAAGQWDRENFIAGKVTLEQPKEGSPMFSMSAGRVDLCLRGSIPAVVSKTDDTTIIEVMPVAPGCDVFRYVIRNDGSGGRRENKVGERWINDGFDHGLTPLK